MRVIDADALLEEAWDVDCRCGYVQVVDVGSIEEAPTIEAKPVVHAHWEQVITVVKKIHEYEQEDIQYRCDHCGHIVDDFENYCGGCGAQMFEGVKIPVISMEDVPKIMEEMEKCINQD